MFKVIAGFLAEQSYGPASVTITEIESKRYAKIEPYNYYVVYFDKTINVLLPNGYVNLKCKDGFTLALQATAVGNKIGCLQYSIPFVDEQISNNKRKKYTLSRKVEVYTLSELIDKCIELGLFQI